MWVRRAAIRPVPEFAKIPAWVVERLEDELTEAIGDGEVTPTILDEALERFENDQPVLSDHISEVVGRQKREPALGFGYFLMIAVYLAFERAFPGDIQTIEAVSIKSTEEALMLDEEIRMADPAEVVESDDVIAMEQPHLCKYVQEHLDAALEAHANDIDVDDVHAIYRAVLVEILTLSYAVRPPRSASGSPEVSA
ncbi:MAG: hypothetical protein JNK04_11595 [Myxococcales bacterium]|nr:hypothetical protein [Myxococcales bacterium]